MPQRAKKQYCLISAMYGWERRGVSWCLVSREQTLVAQCSHTVWNVSEATWGWTVLTPDIHAASPPLLCSHVPFCSKFIDIFLLSVIFLCTQYLILFITLAIVFHPALSLLSFNTVCERLSGCLLTDCLPGSPHFCRVQSPTVFYTVLYNLWRKVSKNLPAAIYI